MKYYGNYTKAAKVAIKSGKNGIYCQVADDGFIYINNGFFIFKMNPADYDEIVRPISMCDAGNWIIDNNGKHENTFDAIKLFAKYVDDVQSTEPAQRCPMYFQSTGKNLIDQIAYYSEGRHFSAFYDRRYIDALTGCTVRTNGAINPAVAYIGDDPIAVIMPVRADSAAANAVRAYFSADVAADTTEADSLRAEMNAAQQTAAERLTLIEEYADRLREAEERASQLRAEIEHLRIAEETARQTAEEFAAELETLRAGAADRTDEPTAKTSAADVAAQFAALEGVAVTVKGEKTAAPVVWVTGDTKPHKAVLLAAGFRWSAKRSGWYISAA